MPQDPFGKNPLYRRAGQRIQELARREFARSTLGQLVAEVQRTKSQAERFGRVLTKYRRFGADRAVRSMQGGSLGGVVKSIERYTRKPGASRQVVASFLESLGPVGRLIGSLVSPVPNARQGGMPAALPKDLSAALNFVAAFADEPGVLDTIQGILEGRGYKVVKPGQEPSPERRAPPQGISPLTRTGALRTRIDVNVEGTTRRFPANHPMITGDMVSTPQSSNVYQFGYDLDSWYLYVRFKAPGAPGEERPNAPGPMYQYSNVPPRVFLAMLTAKSKGTFIWDRIRIRGTFSGHQYDYSLVGVTGGYVPRKATLTRHGEEFIPREMRGLETGQVLRSSRPRALVRPLVSTGEPKRGTPRRPNRGR